MNEIVLRHFASSIFPLFPLDTSVRFDLTDLPFPLPLPFPFPHLLGHVIDGDRDGLCDDALAEESSERRHIHWVSQIVISYIIQ